MTYQIDLREGARRQHRSVALFCTLKCRHFDWDGIFVVRNEMEWLLGLDRFKEKRLDWMQEDFAEHFPWQSLESAKQSSFEKLWLVFRPARDDFVPRIGLLSYPNDPWQAREELKKTCLAPIALKHVNGSELALTSLLTMLAHGQLGLIDIFGKYEGTFAGTPYSLENVRSKYLAGRVK